MVTVEVSHLRSNTRGQRDRSLKDVNSAFGCTTRAINTMAL